MQPPILMMYDVHTHHPNHSDIQIAFVNLPHQKEPSTYTCFTAGLHPWHLQENTLEQAKEWLKEHLKQPGCVAVGEAGLDKVCSTDWNLQLQAFQFCLLQSEIFELPLILHCVRTYDELLKYKQKSNQPWIFHGFNKKPEIAQKVLNAGAYLSFGTAILNENSASTTSLKNCPDKRFLLETDTSTTHSIAEIYEQAACLRKIPVKILEEMLEETVQIIFKIP